MDTQSTNFKIRIFANKQDHDRFLGHLPSGAVELMPYLQYTVGLTDKVVVVWYQLESGRAAAIGLQIETEDFKLEWNPAATDLSASRALGDHETTWEQVFGDHNKPAYFNTWLAPHVHIID